MNTFAERYQHKSEFEVAEQHKTNFVGSVSVLLGFYDNPLSWSTDQQSIHNSEGKQEFLL